ncbi:MAG TPA: helix-turn-helix domain-containing protein [Acidimicrobiia bacterium]|nr:helix-turn-helix domain-containing protein [Acidimicrobiia bacterium]
MVPLTDARPLRADARRNREQVLNAAESVLAERGLSASVDEIARRAGVGVGTVCRHFPTKQDLVDAVLRRMFETLVHDAHAALEVDDPGEAFRSFVVALSEFQVRHRALAEQMAAQIEGSEEGRPFRAALWDAISKLLARAQAAGAVRDDIGSSDVAMLVSGVAHAAALVGDGHARVRERYVTIVLDGLRPAEPSALPGRAMSFAQLKRAKERRRS